jgi:hypothetical protein
MPHIYAGVEYGGECFCGVKLISTAEKLKESECNMVCKNTANGVQMCGAGLKMSLYGFLPGVSVA